MTRDQNTGGGHVLEVNAFMDHDELDRMMDVFTSSVCRTLDNANTRKAYASKIKEYLKYCESPHRNHLALAERYLVDEPGSAYFMFYIVFREKSFGKRKKKRCL